jgi:hypothetical protein
MNAIRQQLLINQTEQDSGKENYAKIELLVCRAGGKNCKEHLSVINDCYVEAGNYHLEKDYLNSIESLKCAFLKTTELNQDSCVNCAKLFRSTITRSLENINTELKTLTTGFFRKKRYRESYITSGKVLHEIKMGQ